MPHTSQSADTRAALLALIHSTAGTETGATLCRGLLKSAASIMLDEPDRSPVRRAAPGLVRTLTRAVELAEVIEESA